MTDNHWWITLLKVWDEMGRQDALYGADRQPDDGTKLKVLVEEVGEVARAMQDTDRAHLVTELLQVAATATQQAVMVERESREECLDDTTKQPGSGPVCDGAGQAGHESASRSAGLDELRHGDHD